MTSTAVASKRLLRVVTGFVLAAFFLAIDSVPGRAQLSTDDHLAEPGWWPRRKPYLYQVKAKGAATQLIVTDGERTITANLVWAFGTGKLGQSYLFQQNGAYRESRVTYFSSLQNLDFTPTRALLHPRDLAEATSRPVDNSELLRCFSCHSLGANVGGQLDTSKATLGVTCEACHGPG